MLRVNLYHIRSIIGIINNKWYEAKDTVRGQYTINESYLTLIFNSKI